MNTGERINLAFKHFQEGSLEQAEKDCLEILAEDPENAEVLHLFGITSYHLGAFERAVEYMKKAIEMDDQNADYLYDLGNVYQDMSNPDEALNAYQRALDIEPEHPDAHNNIGMVLHDLGRLEEAISHYQKALELTPQSHIIHNNIALAYDENNENEKAIAHFGRAIQIDPNYADAHLNIGNIFMKEENPDTAYAYYFKSVQLNPNLVEAYFAMAQILLMKSRFAEAIPLLSRLLMTYPDSAEIHKYLGSALNAVWQLDEAVPHLERALELMPEFAEAHATLGDTLTKLGRLDEALEHAEKALLINPEMVEALNALGNIYIEKGQVSEALDAFRGALSLDPDNAESHLMLGLAELYLGNFSQGWKEYESRLIPGDAQERGLPQPLWDGSSLQGKKILVYPEQRVGDEIMFSSCLPEVIGLAEHCIVECDERLVPLYQRSFPDATIIKRISDNGYPPDLPPADFCIPVGSLPRFLRTDISGFPGQKSYLLPDNDKLGEWKARYAGIGDGLKVGISWCGGGRPDEVRKRSTSLESWDNILSVSGVCFVNLQYGDSSEDLKRMETESGLKIHDWKEADPLKDLDGFAAKIAALDLVISVDNPTVHMAGALGVPAWVLLPSVCDWRWMQDYEDTPWYESVRLFRQEKAGEWEGVLGVIGQRLAEAAKQNSLTRETLHLPVKKSYQKSAG